MHCVIHFLLLISLVAALFGCSSSLDQNEEKQVERQTAKIPLEDQKKLEILFQHMMTNDYFACTLVGNKPLTFQEFYSDPWKISSQAMGNLANHVYLDEGWEVWVKYRELFPTENFIFNKIPSSTNGYDFLILINKAAFRKMYHANQDLFQEVLGPDATAERLLTDFEEGKKSFSKLIEKHEGLTGLVLGYGREGSLQVHRDWVLKTEILKENLHPLSPPMQEDKLSGSFLIAIKFHEKRLAYQGVKWHQVHTYQDDPSPDPCVELMKNNQMHIFLLPTWQENVVHILPPNFSVVKGSQEASILKEEYAHAMEIARKEFHERSFLLGFLKNFCKQGEAHG